MRRRELLGLLGTAAAWPLGARAQQPARAHRVAIVHPSLPTSAITAGGNAFFRALFEELGKLGYVEGRNLTVERYSAEGRTERYGDLAGEVVRRSPDLIFAVTTRMVRHVKEATAAIPIVGLTADPVALGLATSLARPGGNLTGVVGDAGIAIWEKRLEIVRETLPQATRAGFVVPRAVWDGVEGRVAREAARRLGIAAVGPPLDTPLQDEEYRRVIATMAREHADVLIVGDSAENFGNRTVLIELAQKYRAPAIYPDRSFAAAGGLFAYGVDYVELYRRAAGVIDEILRGASPGDIPFYQATKFELIVNLTAAKALNLSIPASIIARADEVIE